MLNRKKVYWERQHVVEYWTYSDLHGFREVSKNEGMRWELDTFDYHNQIASDESFETREHGYIKW